MKFKIFPQLVAVALVLSALGYILSFIPFILKTVIVGGIVAGCFFLSKAV
jgi:hypothetical protein